MRVLLVPVGDEVLAVDLAILRCVVGDPRVTSIPTAPASILGALNLRGEVVAVLDTASLLGIGRVGTIGFVAVVEHPHGVVGLAAEGRPVTARLGDQRAPGDLRGAVGSFGIADAGHSTVATLVDPTVLVRAAA